MFCNVLYERKNKELGDLCLEWPSHANEGEEGGGRLEPTPISYFLTHT
jgi:hypothetical protein